jgi:hypothetical protein
VPFPRLDLPKALIQLLQDIISLSPRTIYGAGTPEGAREGNVGDLYINTSGGAGVTLYVKESGNGTNTGWVAK